MSENEKHVLKLLRKRQREQGGRGKEWKLDFSEYSLFCIFDFEIISFN